MMLFSSVYIEYIPIYLTMGGEEVHTQQAVPGAVLLILFCK